MTPPVIAKPVVSNTDVTAVVNAIKAISSTSTITVGGTGVIQDTVLSRISGAERIFGSDRYATNVAVLSKFNSEFNFNNIYFATGDSYPDAICGSVSAALDRSPIILISSNISTDEKTYVKSQLGKVNITNILGGEGVISTDTVNKLLN